MTANGDHTEPDYTAVIDQTVDQLRQAADAATRHAAVKRNEYEAAADQAKRLTRALEALVPSAPKNPANGKGWTISDEKVAAVLEVIRAMDADEFTAADVEKAAGTGTSGESARRACEILRQREVLRLVRTGRGGGKVLALMPDA